MVNRKKGFVLPSTIVSLIVITLFSTLIFSMIIASNYTIKILQNNSENKILAEQIFFNFKNEESLDFEDIDIKIYQNGTKSALVAKKNDKMFCFGIYDFDSENPQTIYYQYKNFDFDITEDEFTFDTITYTLQNGG